MPGQTTIHLCGELQVAIDGARVESRLRGAQGRALFAYLALHRERLVRRDELEDVLWDGRRPGTADALAPPLSRLRSAVGAERLRGRHELQLELGEDVWIDVEAAWSAVRGARSALDAGAAAEALASARAAEEILAAGLLPGLEGSWLDVERERIRDLRADALELIARAAAAAGGEALPAGETAARAATGLAPFRESGWIALLGVLAARGNVAEAYRAFETARVLLRDELGVPPGPDLLAAYDALAAGDRADPATTALPLPLEPIVGRDAEVEAVDALLDRARLVTITGPGGVGKTRLAREVARRVAHRFGDAVFFVELASLASPEHVPGALVAQLGLRSSGDRPELDDVKAELEHRRALLVLDNFEHVVDAAPVVTELLAAAARVSVLVTSRAVLRLRGEQRFALDPLPADAAVRLFTARATAADPGFALTPDNEGEVARIVARLDGLPLAIELAAARIRLLPPAALLARLDDALGLLTVGARDAPERQRTLRGTIMWSCELLAPGERRLLERLGVFAGGFDLEAAEACCAEPGEDLVANLGALVDQSLVRSDGRRFVLLETIREFAVERLREHGGREAARDRHAGYYAGLAEAHEQALMGADQAAALDRLEAEQDNLRAALSWFLERGEVERAIDVGWAVWRFWNYNGHLREGAAWFRRMVDAGDHLDPYLRARALTGAGLMTFVAGDLAQGEELLLRSLPLYREAGADHGAALTTGTLGHLANLRGAPGRAVELLDASIASFDALGDDWHSAAMRNFRGGVALRAGDAEAARSDFTTALDAAQRVDDALPQLLSLYHLAVVERDLGNPEQARSLLLEALRRVRTLGDQASAAHLLEGLAGLEAGNRPEESMVLIAAADTLMRSAGTNWLGAYTAGCNHRDATLGRVRAELDDAGIAQARAAGRSMDMGSAVRYALGER